ncbi:MAG: M20/M25/M40 family metallo-hydrolase [Armatimonadota bacterium]|nr:M20/M25/M40 family metallo-hydrolase [Armatimonadota bacterium]MDR7449829.1 M20/M25/M40 family metallo-hydrolase [Armatimonadota bacterium]MDR7480639.1 M20/M25/M40 family metallo-hydrolase [Armatimonadota bacterium]MDR7488371.1 M20/M25/M40 family metallo-hydrolase [Armatimonadota bacterium]MDR7491050.1 M20/M25/M40 family metallo-hydrolase [Armatimonadota bacterium]
MSLPVARAALAAAEERHRGRFADHVAELAAFCRIPSVGGDDAAMGQAVAWLEAAMRRSGIEVEVWPGEGNHPYLVGMARGAAARTLLFFNHYDIATYTNPIERRPGDRDPFSGAVEGERLYARGVADDKATLLSRIHAVRLWHEANGTLPVTVKFLLEGKRGLATDGLGRFLARAFPRVAADACCWEAGAKDEADRPVITLGHKGQLYVELRCRTANGDYPSRLTALPNSAWRLVWALASLKDPDERVRLPGFYDRVRRPGPAEEEWCYRHLPADVSGLRASTGVRAFVAGLDGQRVMRFTYTEPTVGLCGLAAGEAGPAHRLVIPGESRAHVEFRLVPDQDPEEVLTSLRAHLDQGGFPDITLEVRSMLPPYTTDPDGPLPRLVGEAAEEVYGRRPVLVPFATGIGHRYLFRRYSSMPIVGFAVGYAGSALETNDEHIRLRDYDEGIRHVLAILARAPTLPAVGGEG